MRPLSRRLAVVAAGLAAAGSFALGSAPGAQACVGTPCDQINWVCSLGGGGGCLP